MCWSMAAGSTAGSAEMAGPVAGASFGGVVAAAPGDGVAEPLSLRPQPAAVMRRLKMTAGVKTLRIAAILCNGGT